MSNKSNIRGDTLIEVLFAIMVFSLVAVSSMSIMNQGTATAQLALEITLVRQGIDAQAETLRFLHSSYIASDKTRVPDPANPLPADQWTKISDKAGSDVSEFGTCPLPPPSNSFILNTKTAKFVKPTGSDAPISAITFSQVVYDDPSNPDVFKSAQGIWIEAVRVRPDVPNQNHVGYIDFHIRACWRSPGRSVPVTLGTIVRLYEPY